MLRHMNSLRLLRHDNGWIHTLLEEAENERMHLMTFLNMKQPRRFSSERGVLATQQGVFFNAFFFSYLISPRTCHRFVGYLEEEAVRTYTHALNDIDSGGTDARQWAKERAPVKLAIEYWKMDEDADHSRRITRRPSGRSQSRARQPHVFQHGHDAKEPVRERRESFAGKLCRTSTRFAWKRRKSSRQSTIDSVLRYTKIIYYL